MGGRRLYFLSDRGAGFRLNLWGYDLDTGTAHQVTRFADLDIDSPAFSAGRITFQQGGRLWAVDLPSERLHELRVAVADDGARTSPRDVAVGREARETDVTGAPDYALSPTGDALVIAAHGDLFRVRASVAGADDLTGTTGVEEDHPAWSPDGRSVAYVTEADGAQQLAIRPAAGGAERRLTRFASGVLYTPVWSPDGAALAVADEEHDLWLVRGAGDPPLRIAYDPVAEIRDASFSPDGRWLAYSTTRATGARALHLHEIATGRDIVVSSPQESDRDPVFSPDGRTLYFISQRHELPFVGDRGDEATVAVLKSDGVYAVELAAGSGARASGEVGVEADGLMARATALPIGPARLVSLEARGDLLVYEARPPALIEGELPGETATLHTFDVRTREDRVVVADLDSHVLSADGARVLYHRGPGWRLASVHAGAAADATVGLGALQARVDPRAEWGEMFERAWRLDRDLFFSRVMNGDDWRAVHDAYAPLVARLGSRDDLLYLLRELQGEIATSHAFVGGLDADDPAPPVLTPRLGADLALDPTTGRTRITHVYTGDPTRERFRSPLAAPGVRVRAGDELLAVNGRELRAPTDPDSLLAGAKGELALTVSTGPGGPPRKVRIEPLQDDLDLRQHDWVEANRRRIAELSGGRLGYIFVPDFAAAGSADFARQATSELGHEGLVFDVRWNSGGFTSQAVLSVLRRARAAVFVNRERALQPLPQFAPPRAMAVLTNAHSASDGDQFPFYFRAFGLGPVVGERTWGGVQGIRGLSRLMDGTFITIPKDSLASRDGEWLIENEGMPPDVVVSPAVDQGESGRDAQLEAAVEVVMKRLAADPPRPVRPPPALPAYPPAGDVPPADFGGLRPGAAGPGVAVDQPPPALF